MLSPALRHRQRTLARSGSAGTKAAAMPTAGPFASEYKLLLVALGLDIDRLRNIESIERKIAAKGEMIERYLPWCEGAIEGDTGAQDEIVATMMIWAIDLAYSGLALKLAGYVLRHGLDLPERYRRKPATLIAEEFAEAGLDKGRDIPLATLAAVSEMTAGHDMHDQVRAKLHKATGLALVEAADAFEPNADDAVAGGKAALIDRAIAELERALSLDAKVGVKKIVERMHRERKALAAATDD